MILLKIYDSFQKEQPEQIKKLGYLATQKDYDIKNRISKIEF